MKFEISRQVELFGKIEKYKVKNEFLKRCMAYNNGSDGHVAGFAWDKNEGYVFLTFFVEQALGFRRFPYYEDRIRSNYKINPSKLEKFNSLSEKEIDEIVEEVKDIYNYTQDAFKAIQLNKVNVTRAIGRNESALKSAKSLGRNELYQIEQIRRDELSQASQLYYAKKAAEALNINTIQCSMDILNSFGENEYHGRVQINATLDARDVLYCHELFDISPDKLETKEWVVINRQPKGWVEIPIQSIEVTEGAGFPEADFENPEHAREYLEVPNVLYLPQETRFFKTQSIKFKPHKRTKKKYFLGLF